jgi:hypothetical protein
MTSLSQKMQLSPFPITLQGAKGQLIKTSGLYKSHQHPDNHNHSYNTFHRIAVESPPSTMISSGSKHTFYLKSNYAMKPHNPRVEYTCVVANASVRVAPLISQVKQITFSRGTGNQVHILGEQIKLSMQAIASDRVREQKFREAGSVDDVYTGRDLPVGTHKLYLPLDYTILGLTQPFFPNWGNQDLKVEIEWYSGVISGTATNITCSEAHFLCNDTALTDADAQELVAIHRNPVITNYLDWELVEPANTPSTSAGSVNNVFLDQLHGKCVAMLVALRDSGWAMAGNTASLYRDAGEGSLSLLQPDGGPIRGFDSIPLPICKQEFINHFPSSRLNSMSNRAVYMIPFGDELSDSVNAGVLNGYMSFAGGKNRLVYTQDSSSSVQEVHTVDFSNSANTAGLYRIAWGPEMTDSLAYNANVATIKSTVEALPSFKRNGWTVTASGTAEADLTFTFGVRDGSPFSDTGYKLEIIPDGLRNGDTPPLYTAVDTVVSTVGKTGRLASAYSIDVYCLMLKKNVQLPNGAFRDEYV